MVDKCVQIDDIIKTQLWLEISYEGNREHFPCLHSQIKHERVWENSSKLCKSSTESRICLPAAISCTLPRVQIWLCKHGKVLYCLKNVALSSRFIFQHSCDLLLQLKFDILDLTGILEHVFDKLKVNPSKHKVEISPCLASFFFPELLIRFRRLVCLGSICVYFHCYDTGTVVVIGLIMSFMPISTKSMFFVQ